MADNNSQVPLILALDQGTTSTRAVVFDLSGTVVASAQEALTQIFPRPGWVEHDPLEILASAIKVCQQAMSAVDETVGEIVTMGITNQRETVVVWDRHTGEPVHNAIVWQDRRTAELCRNVVEAGHEATIQRTTGLVIDAYFSASKLRWLLDNIPGLRVRAERADVLAGTIDSFLIWHLTRGSSHVTDATNASRTMLFDIHTQQWSRNLLDIWNVPRAMLPEVLDCTDRFGVTDDSVLGRSIPITGVAGDQHAATVGQVCFSPGMAKCTYGTGAFLLLNTGQTALVSNNRLLTTTAYRIANEVTYALEGSIFSAGSAVQWLRDGLGVVGSSAATASLAAHLPDNDGVYLVPAFTGLGAPWWDPDARGAIVGLTRDTGPAHLARAALESVAYQTADLLRAMAADGARQPTTMRIDGGMAGNDWLCQFIADMLACPVQRPANTETTVLGAALLAGVGAGLLESPDSAASIWQLDREFTPRMPASERDRLLAGWHDAVERVRSA